MKACFIFDTVLVKEKENYYGMTLNYDFFKLRYLEMFDTIIVSTRAKNKEDVKGTSGYKILNGENVEIRPIKDYNEIPDAILNSKKIKKNLREIINSVDKVIIRMPSVLGIMATKICDEENKDYIVEMVACPWDGYINHTNPIGKFIAPIMYFKTKKCVKKAPKVLYVTNKFLQDRYPTSGAECACSDVILKEVSKDEINNRKNNIQNLDFNSLKLCTVANIGLKFKGHKYVFDAIKMLKDNGKDMKYYLIGNGDKKYLESYANKLRISDNIIFLGSLPHDEVFKKLKEMDLYIQPSLQEGLPRALIEAMSLGMPAIGSNVGGIPELLNKEMIFEKKKYKQLYKIILSLDKNKMLNYIDENYEKSQSYLPSNLNEKRMKFYMESV